MQFVFSRRFFILIAFGILPLSLSWSFPGLSYAVFAADLILIAIAVIDYFVSRKLPKEIEIERTIEGRLAIGEILTIKIDVRNLTTHPITLKVKDEVPEKIVVLDDTRTLPFAEPER